MLSAAPHGDHHSASNTAQGMIRTRNYTLASSNTGKTNLISSLPRPPLLHHRLRPPRPRLSFSSSCTASYDKLETVFALSHRSPRSSDSSFEAIMIVSTGWATRKDLLCVALVSSVLQAQGLFALSPGVHPATATATQFAT